MWRSRAFAIILFVIPVGLPVAIGLLIAATAVDVPFWDEWEWADLIYKLHSGTLAFADLWAQHNEHRIFFPNLIMIALDRLGGWNPVREQFVSLFFTVCAQIGLFVMLRRTLRPFAASIAFALASIVLYGLWQAENFTWGFEMGWFICNAACVGVVALLTRPNRTVLDALGALTLSFIASFSLSSGLVVWLAGAIAIVVAQRDTYRALAVWLPAGAATYALYRFRLIPSTAGHFNVFLHPLATMRYVSAYLGSPIARANGATVAALFGLLLFVALVAGAVADVRDEARRKNLTERGPWYALAAYPLACAFATASGRAGMGLDQALASRYTGVSDLAWIALIAIGASYIAQHRAPMQAAMRAQLPGAAAALAAVLILQSEVAGWKQWMATTATLSSARLGLENNDPQALPKLYPAPARIEALIDELRLVHDGPFING